MIGSRNGKSFEQPSETPEEIVGLLDNIGNRPDIRAVQDRQVKEIREFAAKQLELYGQYAYDHIDFPIDEDDVKFNDFLIKVRQHMKERAAKVRSGTYKHE